MTVVGVIEDIPQNSSIQFDAVIPLENLRMFYGRDDFLTTWYNNGFTTFGLLTSPSGFDKIATTITRRIQKEMPESTNYLRAYLFKNGYLYEQQHIRNVRIFSLIAILVLLAAVLNFIKSDHCQIDQASQGKLGLRKSIGATRGNIIKLVYSEVAFLCFFGAGTGTNYCRFRPSAFQPAYWQTNLIFEPFNIKTIGNIRFGLFGYHFSSRKLSRIFPVVVQNNRNTEFQLLFSEKQRNIPKLFTGYYFHGFNHPACFDAHYFEANHVSPKHGCRV